MTVHDLTLWNFKNINQQKLIPQAYYIKDAIMKFVMKRGMRRAVYVITDSDFVRMQLIEKFDLPPVKVKRIYYAAEATYQKPRIDLQRFGIDKPYILYVGNAYPHKNLERLILAFGKLLTDYMLDLQLVLAGRMDDFHKKLQKEVNESGLKDKIIFTDYVTNSELAGLYKNASIYSFPSLSEGFGLPGLEAMSYGLPVASSDATCLPEIYGDAVAYYNPQDTDNMAEVMANLIADTDKQESLRERGYARLKLYSWDKCARQTLAVYKRALKK